MVSPWVTSTILMVAAVTTWVTSIALIVGDSVDDVDDAVVCGGGLVGIVDW